MNVGELNTRSTAALYTAVTRTEDQVKSLEQGAETAIKNEEAAVYEPSNQDVTKLSETERKALVDQLKADTEAQMQRLTDLVWKMVGKQAGTSGLAEGDQSIWDILRTGNFTVDAQTQKEAQEAISEDGYWGVEQTSDRIVKFATALTGGDPSKLDEMIEAFKKGYDEAEKAWGGELPEISQRTREAVLQKFDDLKRQAGLLAE